MLLPQSPFGPWRPDAPDYNNPGVTVARNVVPAAGYYGPLKRATLFSGTSMVGRPIGAASGKDRSGNARVYAGSPTRLYKLLPATTTWSNISRTGGYTTAEGERWESTEYGGTIFMTNFADNLQYIDMNVDTVFADATTLVKGRHPATVREFVVVGNVYDPVDQAVPYRVRWSGAGLPLSWGYSAATQADFQDIYGYGAIQHIVGGEAGYVLMRNGIVKMTYTQPPLIFNFDPLPSALGKGCMIPQSVKTVQGKTFFVSDDGFYMLEGDTLQGIGYGKVDRWFLNDIDTGAYAKMSVVTDPDRKLIQWQYASKAALGGEPDRMLILNYETGEWSVADATTSFLFNSLSLPWTIERLSVFGTIEAIPASFDSNIWSGGNPLMLAMKMDGSIYTFGGDTLGAIIETQEQSYSILLKQLAEGVTGDQAVITKVRPIIDGDTNAALTVRVGKRNLSNGHVAYTNSAGLNSKGNACFRDRGRYHRLRFEMSGSWAQAVGYELDASPGGSR